MTEQREWVRGDWMQTYTGKRFYPRSPHTDDLDAKDIAHALSLLCRYGGHVDRFYSVAEHCVLMSEAVPAEHALAALLHDATEAYVCDIPRPLKRQLPGYQEIEGAVWTVIAMKFRLELELPDVVKDADNRILLNEKSVLFPRAERWGVDDLEPLHNSGNGELVEIMGWPPTLAEYRYAKRLRELTAVPA